MAQFVVRNLDEDVKAALKAACAGAWLEHGGRGAPDSGVLLFMLQPSVSPGLGVANGCAFCRCRLEQPLPEFRGQGIEPVVYG